jgi:5'-deoxynucleotidase YfbR-like HD superfamily hydrolase
MEKRIDLKRESRYGLLEFTSAVSIFEDIINKIPDDLDEVLLRMSKIEKFDQAIEAKVESENKLKDLIANIKQQNKIAKSHIDADKILTMLSSIEAFDKKVDINSTEYSALLGAVNSIKMFEDQIKTMDRDIVVFENQLPAICPTCGQPFGGCND